MTWTRGPTYGEADGTDYKSNLSTPKEKGAPALKNRDRGALKLKDIGLICLLGKNRAT